MKRFGVLVMAWLSALQAGATAQDSPPTSPQDFYRGKQLKLCEDCADRAREADEVAEASESVVQDMMGFKGRR